MIETIPIEYYKNIYFSHDVPRYNFMDCTLSNNMLYFQFYLKTQFFSLVVAFHLSVVYYFSYSSRIFVLISLRTVREPYAWYREIGRDIHILGTSYHYTGRYSHNTKKELQIWPRQRNSRTICSYFFSDSPL